MHWAAFTTLCRFRQSRAEQFSYQAEMHSVRIFSIFYMWTFKRNHGDMPNYLKKLNTPQCFFDHCINMKGPDQVAGDMNALHHNLGFFPVYNSVANLYIVICGLLSQINVSLLCNQIVPLALIVIHFAVVSFQLLFVFIQFSTLIFHIDHFSLNHRLEI